VRCPPGEGRVGVLAGDAEGADDVGVGLVGVDGDSGPPLREGHGERGLVRDREEEVMVQGVGGGSI